MVGDGRGSLEWAGSGQNTAHEKNAATHSRKGGQEGQAGKQAKKKKRKTREETRNESAGAFRRPLARVGGRIRRGGSGHRARGENARPNARSRGVCLEKIKRERSSSRAVAVRVGGSPVEDGQCPDRENHAI